MSLARMHVVSHKAIQDFCQRHAEAHGPLDLWYRVAKRALWSNVSDIRQTFNSADWVSPFVVFDIGRNKYRLIAEINFSRKVLFIRRILTHAEYSKGAWKK